MDDRLGHYWAVHEWNGPLLCRSYRLDARGCVLRNSIRGRYEVADRAHCCFWRALFSVFNLAD